MSYNIAKSLLAAMAYAQNRINKEKSEDPDIINEICSNICKTKPASECTDCKNGIKWKPDNKNKIWQSGQGSYFDKCDPANNTCKNNLNCVKNPNEKNDNYYCGFNSDEIPAGNTIIANKSTCINLSVPVYKCPANASSLDDCSSTLKDASTGSNGLRYAEWHADDSTGPNNTYGGKCVYGNFTAKAYAEFPQSHSAAKKEGGVPPPFYYDQDNGKMYITPEYCNYFGRNYGTGSQNNSNPDASCDDKGGGNYWGRSEDVLIGATERHMCVSEDTESKPGYYGAIPCKTDADCPISDPSLVDGGTMTNTKCINIDKTDPTNKICMGDSSSCFITTDKETVQMLVGNTMFNALYTTKAVGDCVKNSIKDIGNSINNKLNDTKENYQDSQQDSQPKNNTDTENISKLFSNFNGISDQVSKLSDSKYMENKKILAKDYAGKGVHLYLIKWDLKATKLGIPSINDIGFDYDEIVKKHPEICTKFKNSKFISINKKQLTNNDIKRIYVYIGSNGWIKSMINSFNK